MPSPPPSPAPPQSQSRVSSRVPALLEPYVACGPLARDEGSLTLITWVQGASANWLLLRYLYALLLGGSSSGGGGAGPGTAADWEEDVPGVVLVSFLRDARFWAEGCTRLGMDLDALRKSRRFSFVDGLTGLHTASVDSPRPSPSSPSPSAPRLLLPSGDANITGPGREDAIKTQVEGALSGLSTSARKILLIDGLDAYVAMTPAGSASQADSLLMSLRENVYSTLLTMAADEPLMQAAQGTATTTSLEREHAALVLGQAHAADQVVSLRRLDTGAAADVSGVLRVATRADTAGAGGGEDCGESDDELLYHVSGDGMVRVFERGA